MKEIYLTEGVYALVDNEDYDWINDLGKWTLSSEGYAVKRIGSKVIKMHRLIMFAESEEEVDHWNQNRVDNQKRNLRFCSHSQNQMNARKRKHTSSVYKGVSRYRGGQWQATITVNGKLKFIGHFPNERWAAMAWDIWAKDLHGEFACLNFVPI